MAIVLQLYVAISRSVHGDIIRADNVNVHRAAAKIIVSKSRAARGSVCNVLLSRSVCLSEVYQLSESGSAHLDWSYSNTKARSALLDINTDPTSSPTNLSTSFL